MVSTNTDKLVKERVKKTVSFLAHHKEFLIYGALLVVILLSVYIRMLPTATSDVTGKPGLWDIAANDWTLGPDLDPFLFLRWAQYIVDHGSLMDLDTMRYAPLGFQTNGELILLPYSIAWFHHILSFLNLSPSVTYSAIVFPVFFFALTLIGFFFMTKEMFSELLHKKQAALLAVIASLFLAVLPALLPRTIAGIPEKESAGFFFIFLTFFLFMKSWKSEKRFAKLAFAFGAALTTSMMSLIWGGVIYIFITLALTTFLAFFFGKVTREHIVAYSIWIIGSLAISSIFSSRYTLGSILNSTMTLIPLGVLLLIIADEYIVKRFSSRLIEKTRLPRPLLSCVLLAIAAILLGLVAFGPSFLADKVGDIVSPMITPVSDRLGVTVAENRQPFFDEWAASFGPSYSGIPVFFWLFVLGSIGLVYFSFHSFEKRQRLAITGAYLFFLFALIFSRYTSTSLFNGTNFASITFYLLGLIALVGTVGFYYVESYKKESLEKFKSFDFGLLLLFVFFFLSIVSARGSVRTIMVLVPTAAIMASFLPLAAMKLLKNNRNVRIGVAVVIGLLLVLSAWSFFNISKQTAIQYTPSIYTFQWQKAMSWVRDNTPPDAVFAHWWDYGYWVQSIGERATILDGGNAVAYWNHLMGRLVLTAEGSKEALPFLFAHNATHLLIDSSEIGKYSAFASIGSDETYDRSSYIPSFTISPSAVEEKKNSSVFVYQGSFGLDEDITYNQNGTRIFLPAGQAAVIGIVVEKSTQGTWSQPQAIFAYQGRQYAMPLRYTYVNGSLIDFESGLEAGVFVYPAFDGQNIHFEGSLLYLSSRTIKSNIAQLYLFEQPEQGFTLAHIEDDIIVSQIKQQVPTFNSDFLDYQGFRGPIKIWEIHYPSNMQLNQSYFERNFPNSALNEARR